MSYTLESVKYIPSNGNIKILSVNLLRRIPVKSVLIGRGYLAVFGNKETAKFEFNFKDENGVVYYFDAYNVIIRCMKNKNLTGDRRKRIVENVKRLASYSDSYEPEEWFISAIKSLKI